MGQGIVIEHDADMACNSFVRVISLHKTLQLTSLCTHVLNHWRRHILEHGTDCWCGLPVNPAKLATLKPLSYFATNSFLNSIVFLAFFIKRLALGTFFIPIVAYLAVTITNFGSLYPTWFGQEMTFVISEIRYKRVRYIEVLLYIEYLETLSGF